MSVAVVVVVREIKINCFLFYIMSMEQRNIPNSNREGLTLTPCNAPLLLIILTCIFSCSSPTRVVASNLESNPGWEMGSETTRDWSLVK